MPPPFPLLSPFRLQAKEGEGDPPGASREWRGGRGRPVLPGSHPLSRSGSHGSLPRWYRGDGAPGRAVEAGGGEGEAAPPHAQHTLPRPLPRTPPRCSAHVGTGEEAGEMRRKAGTHPPAWPARPGRTLPPEMAHRDWLPRGRAPCRTPCVQASGRSGLPRLRPQPPDSIAPSLHPPCFGLLSRPRHP